MSAETDAIYTERNMCVSLLCRMAMRLGYKCGIGRHQPIDDPAWDASWTRVIFIDLPSGQVSWHIHDGELRYFRFLPKYETEWDGHTTEEKYRRVLHPCL